MSSCFSAVCLLDFSGECFKPTLSSGCDIWGGEYQKRLGPERGINSPANNPCSQSGEEGSKRPTSQDRGHHLQSADSGEEGVCGGRALSQTFHWVLLCALCKEGVCFSLFVDAKTFFCLRLGMYTVWVGVRTRVCACTCVSVREKDGNLPAPVFPLSFVTSTQ